MRVLLAAAAVAACVSVSGVTASAWRDARGLEFVSEEAFCRYHCSETHVAQAYRHLQERSECTEARCGSRRRALRELRGYSFQDSEGSDGEASDLASVLAETKAAEYLTSSMIEDKDVETVDFMSCQEMDDAEAVRHSVSLRIGDPDKSVFDGFHKAFFDAYDAMLGSSNATYDACRLQFVQDALFSNFTDDSNADSSASSDFEIKPMLVKLDPKENELQCLDLIHEIWTPDDESFTPFLTRSDQDDGTATVMLIHISKQVADLIVDLACVDSVTLLPSILKLTPFARASVQLERNTDQKSGPQLELRLVKGANRDKVFARLQKELTAVTGIKNALSQPEEESSNPRVIWLESMDDSKTWTQALAVILEDEGVEWVDIRETIHTGALRPGQAFEQRLTAHGIIGDRRILRAERRLDAYVQELVGVKEVRKQKITGTNIIVGVTDTGLYIDHDQFDQDSRDMYDAVDPNARKVVLYRAFGNRQDESEQVVCGHGTHVSGILAGSSLSQKTDDLGIASSARIAFMDIGKQSVLCEGAQGCEVKLETPGEVETLMKNQVDAGARIFSFSWGTGGNDYNTQSRDLDNYIYNNPDILIIVAAGNSGDKGARTISSPSGAKNVISVGASLNDVQSFVKTPCASVLNQNTVASFSSMGPTLDGRLKPDLVAPGMAIDSAQSEAPGSTTKSTAICSLQGTSQATPVVAGMAVLLYEWLRDGWWKHGVKDATYGLKTIPAALLKALLIHSGEKMSRRLVAPRNGVTSCVAMESAAQQLRDYPDPNQGYGKPTMANIVSFLDDQGAGVYFFPNSTEGSEPRVTEGAEAKFTFMLTDRANLRVTLVWTDPAGSVGGKIALQNDLDLSVRVPNTQKVFYPLSGNGTRDSRNNVEMVEVSFSDIKTVLKAEGVSFRETDGITVEAVVFGRSVKAGARTGQPFALVASSSPSYVETMSTNETEQGFWQPWMTVGVVVGGTLLVLFVIAVGWRIRSGPKDNLKADLPPSASAGYQGAGNARSGPSRTRGGSSAPRRPPSSSNAQAPRGHRAPSHGQHRQQGRGHH
ncbi:hypothetical protein Poli38472_010707 [Pythium oligandrum]|uniref:subtilisin n=1 Tax=Pythium oligandrum TaxID=41045 RepID=A0A8K1CDX2_PYTOL|nr:hypothetical protein Poli38472_010707 [Pythium oligandrum]|eukprot:TMW61644.1 hypothetical protein Poli38472_010707 [Pythium oligandrum]